MIYGTASMIDGLVKKIERELGYPTIKLATGGLQELVTPYCEIPFLVDQEILLYGLYKIYATITANINGIRSDIKPCNHVTTSKTLSIVL
mgnify:CR=1 FL=1